ncbi:chaplin family protein [Streptomyces sp. NPDC006992]
MSGTSPGVLCGDDVQLPAKVGAHVCGDPLLSPAAQNHRKNHC